jgi:hypothetical protein
MILPISASLEAGIIGLVVKSFSKSHEEAESLGSTLWDEPISALVLYLL